ncbi:MAG: hypothetical protein ABI914_04525 [Acidobacteriota bacterium]
MTDEPVPPPPDGAPGEGPAEPFPQAATPAIVPSGARARVDAAPVASAAAAGQAAEQPEIGNRESGIEKPSGFPAPLVPTLEDPAAERQAAIPIPATAPPPPSLQPPFPNALADPAAARAAPPSSPLEASPVRVRTDAPDHDSAAADSPSQTPRRRDDRPRPPRGPRPDLKETAEPVFRESRGYRMRLEPADLTRLRELPGSKGKTDRELGETFFDGQSDRFTASLAEDVPSPAEVRVVVDPYSRQAFLAVEKKIRSILSF